MSTDARTLLNNLSLSWGSSTPPGLRSSDFWAARFSFVLLVPATGNVTFGATVDDDVSIDIDGDMLLAPGGSRRVVIWLSAGFHDVVVHYLEATGSATMQLTWDGGVRNAVSRWTDCGTCGTVCSSVATLAIHKPIWHCQQQLLLMQWRCSCRTRLSKAIMTKRALPGTIV